MDNFSLYEFLYTLYSYIASNKPKKNFSWYFLLLIIIRIIILLRFDPIKDRIVRSKRLCTIGIAQDQSNL